MRNRISLRVHTFNLSNKSNKAFLIMQNATILYEKLQNVKFEIGKLRTIFMRLNSPMLF